MAGTDHKRNSGSSGRLPVTTATCLPWMSILGRQLSHHDIRHSSLGCARPNKDCRAHCLQPAAHSLQPKQLKGPHSCRSSASASDIITSALLHMSWQLQHATPQFGARSPPHHTHSSQWYCHSQTALPAVLPMCLTAVWLSGPANTSRPMFIMRTTHPSYYFGHPPALVDLQAVVVVG